MDKIAYDKAVEELGKIVEMVENPDSQISDIEGLMKRAVELIAYCKKELRECEEDFSSLLDEK